MSTLTSVIGWLAAAAAIGGLVVSHSALAESVRSTAACDLAAGAWSDGTVEKFAAIESRRGARQVTHPVNVGPGAPDSNVPLETTGELLGRVRIAPGVYLEAIEVETGGTCWSSAIVLARRERAGKTPRYAVVSREAEHPIELRVMSASERLLRIDGRLFKVEGQFQRGGWGGVPLSMYEYISGQWTPRCSFRAQARYLTVGSHASCTELAKGSFSESAPRSWTGMQGQVAAAFELSGVMPSDPSTELLSFDYAHGGGCGGTRRWAYYRNEFDGKSREEIIRGASRARVKTLGLQLAPSARSSLAERGALEELIEHFQGAPLDGRRWPEASSWHMSFLSTEGASAILTDSADEPRTVGGVRYDLQLLLNGKDGPEVVCRAKYFPRIVVE